MNKHVAPRGIQNIDVVGIPSKFYPSWGEYSGEENIASNQNQINRVELYSVTVAIPGPVPSRDLMSRIYSQRTAEFHDVITAIHSRAVDSDPRIVTQDEMVPPIQQNHGMYTHPGDENSHPLPFNQSNRSELPNTVSYMDSGKISLVSHVPESIPSIFDPTGAHIPAVIPKPSEKNENLDIASHEVEHIEKSDHRKRIEMSSNRTLPSDIIKSLTEPNNLIGEPSEVKYNKFQALKLVDFHESEVEKHQWNTFESMLISYGFVKDHVKEKHIIIPGLKTYLSYSQKTTEASTFHSIAVLDDPADSKETVVKTLNTLHDRFQIGNKLQYLVVVGDGKSYDHLIKLKAEYGCVLDWVFAISGDWHILKNILPIFIKIFYDAGLKNCLEFTIMVLR
ncbi:unnamed protein product [Mytilus coruscus]|uniref:Uncharacterized protein n=1 Tax=Mytilus coruscus TaxID=42192 RepID=A0A6J8EQE8_MYTCO|nr:unnamed protein product [Mytilus coruscus]